jgi:hypothetical protein
VALASVLWKRCGRSNDPSAAADSGGLDGIVVASRSIGKILRLAPLVKDLEALRCKRIRVEHESIMLPQKWHESTALRPTLRLVFRALIEVAEPTEILSRHVEQEDVDLMVSDAYLLVLP